MNTIYGNEEIAAFTKNDVSAHFDELDHLKNQVEYLQKQVELLTKSTEEAVQTKEQILKTVANGKKAQFNAMEFLKKEVASLKSQIESSQKTVAATPEEVAFWNKTKTEPAPSPAPIQPSPMDCCRPSICLTPAYNQSAAITTQCSWNVWANFSLTIWQASQDNMEVGVLSHQIDDGASAFGSFIQTEFKYKPGFKLEAGYDFDYDKWDLSTRYTWFRSTTSVSQKAPAAANFPADYYQIWPIPGAGEILSDAAFTELHSDWRIHMDVVELMLGRWHYIGTKLTCHPYAGLRTAFIRQNFYAQYTHFMTPPPVHFELVETRLNSNSWALGPEIGFDLDWMFWRNFRVISSVEGDVLYTQYTRLHDTNTSAGVPADPVIRLSNTETNLPCVRSHIDMSLGLGWGKYLRSDRFYLNFTALYEFQTFFDQNMFHRYFSSGGAGSVRQGLTTAGNLYIQGLTLDASLNF